MASATASTQPTKPPASPESYESLARRNAAAEILQSYEKLSWWSAQRCESIVQTRLHFQNIVAHFTSEDEAARVHWKTDNTPHADKKDAERRSSGKGKEPASVDPTRKRTSTGSGR